MPKIVRFHKTGEADVLQVEDLPVTDTGKGEVRLKVEAIGLNRAEIMFRRVQYLEVPQFPSRLGYEASGFIDAVGPDVSGLRISEHVSTIPSFPIGQYGVYGESAIVPASAVAGYSDNLLSIEGAAIWMQYMTAYGALIEFGQLRRDDAVLITAASSSVGLAAIQITKAMGALAIATTRGSDKKAVLLEAGAKHFIVMDEEDLVEQGRALTAEKGFRIVFYPIAGPFIEQLADVTAISGLIFEYGALSPSPTPFPLFPALSKALTIRGYTLFEIVQDPDMLSRGKDYIYRGLQYGSLRPIIDRAFPLR